MFLPNPKAPWITQSDHGGVLDWARDAFGWFFAGTKVDEEDEGVFKISIACEGMLTFLGFGVAPNGLVGSDVAEATTEMPFGCCGLKCDGIYYGTKELAKGNFFKCASEVELDLELDADRNLMHFFVNGRQIPNCVRDVPIPAFFMVVNHRYEIKVSMKSFQKLIQPTANPSMKCTIHNWN